MPRVHVLTHLDGQSGAHTTCSHRHSMDVIIMPGVALIVDDAMSVIVRPEPFTHRWLVWSGCWVGQRHSRGLLLHARQLLWLVDGVIQLVWPQSPGWARGRVLVSRHGAFRLLNGDSLHQRSEVLVDCLLLGVGRLEEAT